MGSVHQYTESSMHVCTVCVAQNYSYLAVSSVGLQVNLHLAAWLDSVEAASWRRVKYIRFRKWRYFRTMWSSARTLPLNGWLVCHCAVCFMWKGYLCFFVQCRKTLWYHSNQEFWVDKVIFTPWLSDKKSSVFWSIGPNKHFDIQIYIHVCQHV